MFAAHIIEPAHMGIPERHRVLLTQKRSERDAIVRYVNESAKSWAEYRRRHPSGMVPPCFDWYPSTTCEPITMREAHALIGDDDVIFEHDGWCRAYAYKPCDVYEFTLLPYGERIGWKAGRHYHTIDGEEVAA